jgi:uncharacterized DUF497 family protein
MIFFEWDKAKAESNEREHGVTFEDAMSVFRDPDAVFEQDRIVDGEARWIALGIVDDDSVVVVAHSTHEDGADETVRIISARLANRQERRRYGKHRAKNAG